MSAPSSEISFVKMHGAGNDYVFIDAITQNIPTDVVSRLACQLSDRHKGVGSDGLILLASSKAADIAMKMWNADGSRGAMCGNGLRCLAKLAYDLGHVKTRQMLVETDSGNRSVRLLPASEGPVCAARVDMGRVRATAEPEAIEINGRSFDFHPGDAGNPHAVIFLESGLSDFAIDEIGKAFQAHDRFPDGVNVEFVEISGPDRLDQRTYERGSGETQACGSGATVAALAAMASGRLPGPSVEVRLLGGELRIERAGETLVMEGPAEEVFRGQLRLEP
ncbi:MAG: diaminopimelate epimerase [Planctomycetota bacterium]|jgi:diaminopimelate epimerase